MRGPTLDGLHASESHDITHGCSRSCAARSQSTPGLIGDVADHIPPKYRDKHPEIDWGKLMGLHHMIEHQYGDTLAKRVWFAATESLPEMMGNLKKLL